MSQLINESDELTQRAPEIAEGRRRSTEPLITKSERVRVDQVNWWALGWLGVAHIGALFAPWTFTWQALIVTVLFHWICGSLGICLGYHRMLTHTGFRTYRPIRYMFAVFGSMAGEGSPLDWVSDHRKHHAHSDLPGDPHSPHDGSWWSHVFWLAFSTHGGDSARYYQRWVPDLANDRGMWVIDRMFLPINIMLGMVLTGFGYWLGGIPMAISMLVWGVFLRLVLVLHSTWLVNSASHIWGYRNYETTDNSRNNWFVAIVSYGEGWHNNHHAYPRMAKHGHRWWEIDMTWWAIRTLRTVGLAWDVVDYRTAAEKRQQSTAA